jgi:biotin carboxyl carrier protein
VSIRIQHEKRDHEVDLRRAGTGWTATVDGRELAVDVGRDGDGRFAITIDGVRRRVYVAAAGDERWVFVAGRTLRLRRPDPDSAPGDDTALASPDIRAAMPGKVVKLLVEEGQQVAYGQPIIILESMKMETEISASVDGTVTAIHVAAGETVGQDASLVDIEPATGGA